jgi:hypothetical protein
MPNKKVKRNARSGRRFNGQQQNPNTVGRGRPATMVGGPNPLSALRWSFPVFGSVYRTKLHYYEPQLTAGNSVAGLATNYFFSANGCFDPNITGVGHQPIGFDQIMLFYEQYTVVSSKATVTTDNRGTTPCRTALYLSPDITSITDPIRIMENGLIATGINYIGNAYREAIQLDLSCSVFNYFGRTANARGLVDDVTLSGSSAANPSEQVYYAVSTWDPFQVAVAGSFFDIVIEYDVIFWEPRKLTTS